MHVKRFILAAVSIAFGAGVTILITTLLDTTPGEFGGVNFILTALSLAIALAIWLDKFMETDILPK